MAPTLIVFKDGMKETVFKAGLDLLFPASFSEVQQAVNDALKAGSF